MNDFLIECATVVSLFGGFFVVFDLGFKLLGLLLDQADKSTDKLVAKSKEVNEDDEYVDDSIYDGHNVTAIVVKDNTVNSDNQIVTNVGITRKIALPWSLVMILLLLLLKSRTGRHITHVDDEK